MQLILRQPAAGAEPDDPSGVVVAASPDTLGREQWLWDVRLLPDSAGYEVVVDRNPDVIDVISERVTVLGEQRLQRPAGELWLAVVLNGALMHGAFALSAGDVAVWEGEDPRVILIEGSAQNELHLQLIRVSRRDGKDVRWVP